MSIELFEHNQTAYESAATMLAETGKAAVIHPTGTGKSFVGFKLCEDNPDKTVCWLSPSDYIFRTQLENLKKTGGSIPQNIKFFTYAKLMYMSDEELSDFLPDYIILDEFHRCGAEIWGNRVNAFLDIYKNTPILGLSATNIRYLDNQRDMADELFDGNVASEMTLGEAIVRGILKAPLYVSTVYSYQKDLEKYTRMSKMPKFKAVRGTAEKYLEELRRTIEKADGLDVIFEKYMPDKCGKYVVFCANREHLDEMLGHVDEWFSKVDKNPKVYKVYSDNPESSGEFAEFKADKSENLKLLFCIDMLNEGVHLDDIDGVILFRPTVSPTVYKQQIGRALTAGKSGTPVIFDIINNFENLYSMGAIEQEMACAVTYYNSLGESKKITVDKFEIIGIVKDCVELFDKLNETFTAGWDEMYGYAKEYYLQNGNLEVPVRCKTENGLSLGVWVYTQRKIRNGKINGALTEERIKKLDMIGMQWESVSDMNWSKNFKAAEEYYIQNGDLNARADHVTESGIKLGQWLSRVRIYRKSNIQANYLTKERIDALDKIGMVWNVPDYIFENNYSAALEYYRIHGNLDVEQKYVTENGVKLGSWLKRLRELRRKEALTENQIFRLDEIKMRWDDKYFLQWENGYEHAKAYSEKFGSLNVPSSYVCEDGYRLGVWIVRQRANYKDNDGGERREKLDSIGMLWNEADIWKRRFNSLKKYYDEHGDLDIPVGYKTDGFCLDNWLNEQKRIYNGERKGKSLSAEQIKMLEELGCDWRTGHDGRWRSMYERLKKYKYEHGDVSIAKSYVTDDGVKLGRWLYEQVRICRTGDYDAEYKKLLSELGVRFCKSDIEEIWEKNYNSAKKYFEENGNLIVPKSYKTADGVLLHSWINNQKNNYKQGKLSEEKADRLRLIGINFNISKNDLMWEKNFSAAVNYYNIHGNLDVPNPYKIEDGFDLGDWIYRQRKNRSELSDGQIKKLDSIGMIWVKCSAAKKTNSDVKSMEKQIAMSIETSVELN